MTERENFFAYIRGEKAEKIPNHTSCFQYMGPSILNDPVTQYMMIEQEQGTEEAQKLRYKDCFGVQWIIDNYSAMVDNSSLLLEDISEWRDKVTFPDTKNYDWDTACEMDSCWWDPEKPTLWFLAGPFMQLLDSLGHANAFCALIEDEEEVANYMRAFTDFIIDVIRNVMPRMKVDCFVIGDDMASAKDMFISPDIYRRIFKPLHKEIFDTVAEVSPDTFREFHLCGHCEEILDDLPEVNAQSWEPAQPFNDIKAFQNRQGKDFGITGGWDNIWACSAPNLTEEEIRKSVRDTIDKYAADGQRYIFYDGMAVGLSPEMQQRIAWADDEADKYGKEYYQKYRA